MRWPGIDDERDGQTHLFDADGMTGPERGTGRLSGLEFHHVAARRIINQIPEKSSVPFRWTINAYRGCSHACVYCLVGDTPVLMADGRSKPLAEVRAGDVVYGTTRRANYRRNTPTPVLDNWQTTKRGYRVTLADGTTLVASGDHRFLTERGWKHVRPAITGLRRFLTTHDSLVGVEDLSPTPPATPPDLRVVSIEDLGVELPMFDITTGTGDFIANGVVSHNCFARPTHEFLGLDAGHDFDTRIVVKVNAVEKLRAELRGPAWAGEHIAMGTNTDPYQRAEGRYRLTRGIVEALGEARNPFSILTKSALVTRDVDVLATAAARTDVQVSFSVGTVDEDVWRATEPGTPHPRRRLDAMRHLAEAGVRVGALMAPVLPGLSDRREQIEATVAAILAAGGTVRTAMPLYLRGATREVYLRWLADHDPDLHRRYLAAYEGRTHLPADYQEWVDRAVIEAVVKHGGAATPAGPAGKRWPHTPRAATVRR